MNARNNDQRMLFALNLARMVPEGSSAYTVERFAYLLLRHAKTHGRLAENDCNGHPIMGASPPPGAGPEYWAYCDKVQARFEAWNEKRTAQVEKRITAIAAELGLCASFQGDPRGNTVKLYAKGSPLDGCGDPVQYLSIPQ